MKYDRPKHQRIKYRFMGMTTFDYGWWYNQHEHEWQNENDPNNTLKQYDHSSHQDCSSFRAFRRKLKAAPEGIEFILVSRWKHNDIVTISRKR